jgi:hypothetical protein
MPRAEYTFCHLYRMADSSSLLGATNCGGSAYFAKHLQNTAELTLLTFQEREREKVTFIQQ